MSCLSPQPSLHRFPFLSPSLVPKQPWARQRVPPFQNIIITTCAMCICTPLRNLKYANILLGIYKITILRMLLLLKLILVIAPRPFQTSYLFQLWINSPEVVQEKIQYLLINFVWPGDIEKLHITSNVVRVAWVCKVD